MSSSKETGGILSNAANLRHSDQDISAKLKSNALQCCTILSFSELNEMTNRNCVVDTISLVADLCAHQIIIDACVK